MSDVYPRRNLGLSENWGRVVEARIDTAGRSFGIGQQSLGGLDRYSASSAQELSRSAERIKDALSMLPAQFSGSASSASPNVSTSWSSIVSLSLAVPPGKNRIEVIATANATLPFPAGGGGTTRFAWPFPLSLVTSEYGPRSGGFHEGMDFAGGAASYGSPIPAAGGGTVVQSEYQSGWGNFVRLVHDVDGTAMSTLYAHMSSTPIVGVGTVVSRGQTLGYVGNTGNSYGAHLHFETWTGTTYGTHADPRWFIEAYGDGGSAPAPAAGLLRLRIGGVSSIEFSGILSETLPRTLTYAPVFGRSLVASSPTVDISLEAISGGSVTGTPATLAVTGAFYA